MIRMKKFVFFLTIVAILSSCKEEGEFDLNFKALYGDEALVLNTSYDLDDMNVKFENLTFLLTDLSLVNANDETIELSDAEFVELNGFDEVSALTGQELIFKNIPTGSYKSLKFTIGVTEDLNAMSPGDFDVDEALGRTDHYWEAWESYIFSKTEGSVDAEGSGVFDLKFFYHTGSDALSRSFVVDTDLTIDADRTSTIVLFMDYNELLRNADGSAFNIPENPRNHDPDELEIVTQYVDNYQRAIKVRE